MEGLRALLARRDGLLARQEELRSEPPTRGHVNVHGATEMVERQQAKRAVEKDIAGLRYELRGTLAGPSPFEATDSPAIAVPRPATPCGPAS